MFETRRSHYLIHCHTQFNNLLLKAQLLHSVELSIKMDTKRGGNSDIMESETEVVVLVRDVNKAAGYCRSISGGVSGSSLV